MGGVSSVNGPVWRCPSFLESHDEMTSKSHLKLLEFLTDNKKKVFLQIELEAFVDIGELFVKAKYNLEGDSPLVLQAYDQIQIVKAKIENPHYPNVDALAISLAAQGRIYQQLKQHACKCLQPGIDYFNSKFFNDSAPLSESLAAFKAARLFVPHRLIEMEAGVNSVNNLTAFPFLNKPSIIDNSKSELPAYITLAQDVAPTVEPLQWWREHKQHLPNWLKAMADVLLVKPSSAVAERVFSMLKASFSHQQDHSYRSFPFSSIKCYTCKNDCAF